MEDFSPAFDYSAEGIDADIGFDFEELSPSTQVNDAKDAKDAKDSKDAHSGGGPGGLAVGMAVDAAAEAAGRAERALFYDKDTAVAPGPAGMSQVDASSVRAWFEGCLRQVGGVDFQAGGPFTEASRSVTQLYRAVTRGDLPREIGASYAAILFHHNQGALTGAVRAPSPQTLYSCVRTIRARTPFEFLTHLVMGFRGLLLKSQVTRLVLYGGAFGGNQHVPFLRAVLDSLAQRQWFVDGLDGMPPPYAATTSVAGEASGGPTPYSTDLMQRNLMEAVFLAPERPMPVELKWPVVDALVFSLPLHLGRMETAGKDPRRLRSKVVNDVGIFLQRHFAFVARALQTSGTASHGFYAGRAAAARQAFPAEVQTETPTLGFVYHMLDAIYAMDASQYPAMQRALDFLLGAAKSLEAPEAAALTKAYAALFKRRGYSPTGLMSRVRGMAQGVAHDVGLARGRSRQLSAWADGKLPRGSSSDATTLQPMLQRMQMELVQCRVSASAAGDMYTYRRAKVLALRHLRKTLESMLVVRVPGNVDQGVPGAERCVELHNSPRHLFTFKTYAELTPDIEDFIMSGDNEKPTKEFVLHKRFELHALFELANVLEEAIKLAKLMHDTLRDVSTGAKPVDDGVRKVFDIFDELVWLQQKTWQEHALDSFYDRAKLTDSFDVPWYASNANLLMRSFRLDDYNPALSDLLRLRGFSDADEQYYAEVDANYDQPPPDSSRRRLGWQSEHACPLPASAAKDDHMARAEEVKDMFERFDAASLQRFFDDIVDRDARSMPAAASMAQRGGAPADASQEGEQQKQQQPKYVLSAPNLSPLIKTQQRRVAVLAEGAKQALSLASKQMSMMAQNEARRVLQDHLQGPLEKVGRLFYFRVRMGGNDYMRSFGAQMAMPGQTRSKNIDYDVNRVTEFVVHRKHSAVMLMSWGLLEVDAVVLYVLKFARVATLLLAMYAAEKIFAERYIRDVYSQGQQAPRLFNVLLLAMSMDACLQLVLTTFVVIASVMIKKKDDTFVLDDDFIALMLKEYLLSTLFVLLLGFLVASVMSTKKYFGYRTDGTRVIRGYSEMMMAVFLVVAVVPFFRLAPWDVAFG